MDLTSLKLHLIQQIITIDDPAVLEKIRRILDEAEGNVLAEGEAPYFKLENRMYTADEVRAMLEEVSRAYANDPYLSNEELAALNADRAAYLRGEGKNYTWDELKARMQERASQFKGDDVSEEEKAELERRHEARLSGKSVGIPAEESIKRIRARRK